MKKNLLIVSMACLLLELGRIVYSGSFGYIFLVWNLFLAFIPYLIATHIQQRKTTGIPLIVLSLLWLLFLPNALYIITDLKHLKVRPPVPEWFDCLLLFCFSTLALLYGLFSFYIMNQVVKKYASGFMHQFTLTAVSMLVGFGVYLGREERWNSWDLFTNPFSLLSECFTLITIPQVWIFSCCYGFAFLGMYHLISSLIHHNHETHKQLT
ncbi:DUF1361 domain-containing protein [Cytophaga aurantiaca]|uniref:DUF1361 domain-containing protein n=1 Tax=Cytophaga aurantiaca TaxID=29530 RepID=UPI000364DCC4|nr:DUF1361 domain-containing protein [Cytophaga aurantiaca]